KRGSMRIHCLYRLDVNVVDINDNVPHFPENLQYLNIAESTVPGGKFGFIGASDLDVGKNDVSSYKLSPNDYFSLEVHKGRDSVSAELVLQKALDRETQPTLNLTVTAVDSGNPPKSGTLQIIINVLDINDNAPVFSSALYKTQIHENLPMGKTIIFLNATDADDGLNAETEYSFRSKGQDHVLNVFQIDSKTGAISVKGKIDYEENPAFEIHAEATDKGQPPMSAHCKVLVEVLDLNDNAPEITVTSLLNTVKEDAEVGAAIALVSVLDKDSGNNGAVKAVIASKTPFKLDTNYRNYYSLVVNGPLDRETTDEYNVTIIATDEGAPPLSSTSIISVHVSDVNDNSPRFSDPILNIYVKENSPVGAVIKTLTATDADVDKNGQVSYSFLKSSSDSLPFPTMININSESGDIISLQSFNYEELKTFQFKVQATDSGVPPLSSNVTVNVLILDENDNSPTILAPYSEHGSVNSESIPYSAEAGYFVAKIRAVDADSGYNALLSYHLSEPKGNNLFRIGTSTGEIRTKRRMSDNDLKTHPLVVLVSDNGEPSLSATVSIDVVVINIKDINDNAPVFSEKLQSLDVPENTLPGVKFGLIEASDLDVGKNGVNTYKLSNNDYFSLEIHKGEDSVSAELVLQKSLDREQDSVIKLTLTAVDGGNPPKSGTSLIIISVMDTNDNHPVFSRSLYKIKIPENLPSGSTVLTLNATDTDEGSNRNNLFRIGTSTGEIRTKRRMSDNDLKTHPLVVLVSDNGEPSLVYFSGIQTKRIRGRKRTARQPFSGSWEMSQKASLSCLTLFNCLTFLM
uniref:Cadherin domain-containing protein n=1 Tax=Oreochromis aureus TaxID=47969 RepID=A0AAZ1WYF0_OREAU